MVRLPITEPLSITIEDLTLAGAFSSDGSAIKGGVLKGAIDTRLLVAETHATSSEALRMAVEADPAPFFRRSATNC